jgi:hypothetical protein
MQSTALSFSMRLLFHFVPAGQPHPASSACPACNGSRHADCEGAAAGAARRTPPLVGRGKAQLAVLCCELLHGVAHEAVPWTQLLCVPCTVTSCHCQNVTAEMMTGCYRSACFALITADRLLSCVCCLCRRIHAARPRTVQFCSHIASNARCGWCFWHSKA